MGTPLAREVMRLAARLVATPTDLTAAYPYGGTELAAWARVEVRLYRASAELIAEEWQAMPFDTVGASSRATVSAQLRQWDADALSRLFPSGEFSTTTELLSRTATDRRGELGSARAIKLLIAARDAEYQSSFYIPLAIPLEEEQVRMMYSPAEEWRLPAVFMGIPDATGRCYQKGPLWRMTL